MSLPFDPSSLSVKKAAALLSDLAVEELEALRDAELAGKNRITMIVAIDAELSDDVEEAEVSVAAAPAPARLGKHAPAPAATPRMQRPSRSQMQALYNAAREDRAHAPVPVDSDGPEHYEAVLVLVEDEPAPEPEPTQADPIQI
ncbi:hypothetical protein CMI47_17755 [Candidatus Pacearchaeota archaeon]|nr:hypothetical protein [Candidatus Pacearchaeota archaeon]|tara:strand:- start:337 stop:768 length:432 start_codon:yes stop_codon:yes gene_type:complete